MIKSLEEASEEFRKYLVDVIFDNQHYFAVWGTDMFDEETDKWLLDVKQRIFFFRDIETLSKAIALESNFDDHENLQQWSVYLHSQSIPYNTLDFDILKEDFDSLHAALDDLYTLTGLIEDYAIQIEDPEMQPLFRSELFMAFKEEAANTFLWAGQDEFNKDFDFANLNKECHKIHKQLKHKIAFPSA
ncbi:hypothetical protein [Chitinophaga pinensis]|uniref:Uncharacterized protein n=1 Tax=Chitinophaga pinensis (strain ATCC 43595 / DSM 2588 / LMG 13176 / NBRC 15968 / NCIMB 11800 / UQM 2034) TaxID=485918 RepID=A0A979G4C6_CHIPD|nr:hypothetical protein [Chitinophaga pinensis]ACU60511.1 hypothetical protein Cpin_3037 [Chitinophaga pinensis DSM 2588]